MAFTSGQWGPDTFIDSAGNTTLVGATVEAVGYTCDVDTLGNLTITGPAVDELIVTVTPADGDAYDVTLRVLPLVADLAAGADVSGEATARAAAVTAEATARATADTAEATARAAAVTAEANARAAADTAEVARSNAAYQPLVRATTVAYAATVTPNADTTDVLNIGALTGNLTLAAPTGTPRDGQTLMLRLQQDGTGSRTITYNAAFAFGTDVTAALDPSTASAKWTRLFAWNASDSKWRALAIARGF